MTKLCAAFLITLAMPGFALAQSSPGDARFCQSYAANVSGMGGLAIKKNPACLDYSKGVHGDFKMHYDWCMNNPASSVQGAEANIRRLVSACTGNASRPAPGIGKPQNPIVDLNFRWSGSWVWTNTGRSNNISTLEIVQNNMVSYCYDSSCWRVPYQSRNGVISFSANGKNYFEFRPTNGGKDLAGTYSSVRNAPTAATARFNRAGP